MATVTLKGTPFHTAGDLPAVGSPAPDFVLTATDLGDHGLAAFADSDAVVLNIFPSVDTPTCAASVRRFNAELNALGHVTVLCISADLPFAQARFCGAEGLERVKPLSDFRHKDFGKTYGVTLTDGPLAGLLARAVVVVKAGKVVHTQLVAEIADEPDYAAALAAVKG